MSEVLLKTVRDDYETPGVDAQEVSDILFQREEEDEDQIDGCLWCKHDHSSHTWKFTEEEDGKTMRLRYLACIECARGKDTYQVICYKQAGIRFRALIWRRNLAVRRP